MTFIVCTSYSDCILTFIIASFVLYNFRVIVLCAYCIVNLGFCTDVFIHCTEMFVLFHSLSRCSPLEIKTLKWSISRSVHLYQERGIRGQLQYVFQGFGGKIMHFQSGYAHKHVGSLAESLVIE